MRILVLTHRLPYAPNRGDRIRSYHLLKALVRFADVHLFSLADSDEVNEVPRLESWLSSVTVATPPPLLNRAKGLLTLGGQQPLTHTLQTAPGVERTLARIATETRPDVVLAYCSGMARFAVDGPLSEFPCVLDMVDVDSAKWQALSATAPPPMQWIYRREARVLRRFEQRACSHAFTTLVVNAREHDTLAKIAPHASIRVVENGVDLELFSPREPVSGSQDVVFCGVMDYQPNVEAVVWFAEHVWPAIRRAAPEARFTIVGVGPTPAVRDLSAIAGIEVTGAVEDVRPFLWRAAVSVAPLLTARGLQNKVLEALAAGLPVVATTAVGAGLPAGALSACHLTDDPDDFSAAVIRLLHTTAAERAGLVRSANLDVLSWPARLSELPSIMASAARRGTPVSGTPERPAT